MTRFTVHHRLILGFSLSAFLLTAVGITQFLNYSLSEVLVFIIISIVIVMITGFFIYRSITKPVDGIKEAVREISVGNYDAEIRNKSKTEDELNKLAQRIDKMKHDLKEKEHTKDEFISIVSH